MTMYDEVMASSGELKERQVAQLMELAGKNPGAFAVITNVLGKSCLICPDLEPLIPLFQFHRAGIRGDKLWMLWKDVCGERMYKLLAVGVAMKHNLVKDEEVMHAVMNRGQGLDVYDLVEKVMTLYPKFVP